MAVSNLLIQEGRCGGSLTETATTFCCKGAHSMIAGYISYAKYIHGGSDQ